MDSKLKLLAVFSLAMFFAGCFDDEVTPLTPEEYYNANGVVIDDGIYTDRRDGSTYKVVKLDGYYWFAENLHYAGNDAEDSVVANGSWCYGNSKDSCKTYGRLYSYNAANKACPVGWTLPSVYDWEDLRSYASRYSLVENSGTALKSNKYWQNEDSIAPGSNRFGFNALPGGRHNVEGGELPTGKYAYFWSSTESGGLGKGITLTAFSEYLDEGEYYKDHGMSVRCRIASYFTRINQSGEVPALDSVPYTKNFGALEYEGKIYKTINTTAGEFMVDYLNLETKSSVCYDNKPENCEKYGRLYSASEAGKICPEGWQLPDLVFLGRFNAFDANLLRDTDSWNSAAAVDSYGFSFMATGGYDSYSKSFFDLGYTSYLWAFSNESYYEVNMKTVSQLYYDAGFTWSYAGGSSQYQYPVRCYKPKQQED